MHNGCFTYAYLDASATIATKPTATWKQFPISVCELFKYTGLIVDFINFECYFVTLKNFERVNCDGLSYPLKV